MRYQRTLIARMSFGKFYRLCFYHWKFTVVIILLSISQIRIVAQKVSLDFRLDRVNDYINQYPFKHDRNSLFNLNIYSTKIIYSKNVPISNLAINYIIKNKIKISFSASYFEVYPTTIFPENPMCDCEKDTIFPISGARYNILSYKLGIGKYRLVHGFKFYISPNFTLNRVIENLEKPHGCFKNPVWPHLYHPQYYVYYDIPATLKKVNVGCGIDAGIEYKNISIGYWNRFIAKQKLMTYNYFSGISIGYSMKLFKINQRK